MWEFISQGLFPFAAGFGLGFAAAVLLVVPSVAGAVARLKIGDIKDQEKLSERTRISLGELIAVLNQHGPAGPRPDRDRMGEILKGPHCNAVIAIGDGIAIPVLSLIRAFDRKDEPEYAKAVDDCLEECRYVQLVDSVSGNAIARFSMKIVGRGALAAENKGRSLQARYRTWRAKRRERRERERLEKTMPARPATKIAEPTAKSPPHVTTTTREAPERTTTTTSDSA